MKLQFSISDLSSYLDEVFPKVINQYKFLVLEPGYAKIVQNVPSEILRRGEIVSGPTIFSLFDIGMCILLLAHIGKESLDVTSNCSIDFLKKPNTSKEMVADLRLLQLERIPIVKVLIFIALTQSDHMAKSSITHFRPKKLTIFIG